ncbi:ATP-binding protein [Streptomyces hyderabadensis]|uniref:ATP-binding protein n=1 Tax=Streptomyces hyderabadensis TaxID=598549 RepID=UPI001CF09E56|nr:ATP-binding protein [Streptomyces hyderabadensis]
MVEGHSAAAIAHTRDVARLFVDGLRPSAAPRTAETLALVVSELATNSLRHGGGRYTLELTANAEAVDVAVSDPSPARPQERTPDLSGGTGGFGWPMVRHLASRVTVTAGPGRGKTVHVRLPRRPAKQAAVHPPRT